MKKILLIPMLFLVACFSPSTPTPDPIPTPIHVEKDTFLNNFKGTIFSSPTYTRILNEEPEQFLEDTSKIGISDSLLVVASSSLDAQLYVKKIVKQDSTNEIMFFADFTQKQLADTLNYDAVLYYNGTRQSIQFSYKEYAFFFYDVTK